MTTSEEWEAAKLDHPVGAVLRGRIAAVRPFGMFVEIPGHAGVAAVVDAISYHPDRDPVPPESWPAVGETVEGVVSEHSEHNRQLKLRVG
ncbi:hypothetical protein AB0442_38530 [Kitasatospora sp. NPDC085895]|uniref:hypothetical protein n=1 Tax=Kitasatospora sp. NPDC085895 TaxID=3155057 RepID=UPI00344F94C3